MNKKEAVRQIIYTAQGDKNTCTGALHTYKALRVLGFYVADCYEIMAGPLEFNAELMREVPDLAALPELSVKEGSR